MYIVKMDKKGRILIPSDVRQRLLSEYLELEEFEDYIRLRPLKRPQDLQGKYPLKSSISEIEEKVEKTLERTKREL